MWSMPAASVSRCLHSRRWIIDYVKPFSSISHNAGLMDQYLGYVKQGLLVKDETQIRCLEHMQQLVYDIAAFSKSLETWRASHESYLSSKKSLEYEIRDQIKDQVRGESQTAQEQGWWFGWWPGNRRSEPSQEQIDAKMEEALAQILGHPPRKPLPPRGKYLCGGVGRGKTMIADMTFKSIVDQTPDVVARRVHSNAAFLELHERIHSLESQRKQAGGAASDKQAKMARLSIKRHIRDRQKRGPQELTEILGRSNSSIFTSSAKEFLLNGQAITKQAPIVLCFDELQTTDPYNVAALKALYESTIDLNGCFLTTSNKAPHKLSRHGLHEDMFEHFLESLVSTCDVITLEDTMHKTDYRQLSASHLIHKDKSMPYYFSPVGCISNASMEALWKNIDQVNCEQSKEKVIPVMFGRQLNVARYISNRAAWFDFEDLCGKPLGSTDYLALAQEFDYVFLSSVPAMSMRLRDKARRFITLVDELYNAKRRLVCQADVSIQELFSAEGEEHEEEPLVDLEGLQFEGAVDGAALRGDVTASGNVAPIHLDRQRSKDLGGEEERFAFARAVSRLLEMQTVGYNPVLR